jgi:phytanoyl-CoA hydroxylase
VRSEPTSSEKEFYDDNGFLSVPEFLGERELDRWREVVEAALSARGSQRLSFAPNEGPGGVFTWRSPEDQEYYEGVFTQRINLWQTNEVVKSLMFNEALARFAGNLAGVDGLRIWHDQALVKEPYGNPTGFHLDVPNWSFTSPDAITIWVALDDATLENGCLYYVPGSHKAKKFDNVTIGKHIGALFDIYPQWREVAAVPCPVPAGGALFHNGLTFHGAGPNMTPGRRRAMTCAYMPDGAIFNGQQNVLPPEYFKSLRVGDMLNSDSQNPLVYQAKSVASIS